MTQLVDTARDVDERTARDIADAVRCNVRGCYRPARWVATHECGATRFVCHTHRRMIDHEAATWTPAKARQMGEPVCGDCRQPWPYPWRWDRI